MGADRAKEIRARSPGELQVRRSRLLDHLHRQQPGVVVLAAPAGYGKTTLIEQWAAEDNRPCTGAVLDAADNEPGRLMARLGGTFSSPDPAVVVLDDVHVLTSKSVLDEIKVLAERLPHGSTLVLSGRSVPDLLLGMARARRHVVDIDLTRLGFDVAEAAQMCRLAGIDRTDVVERLVRHSEGWPAAIRMAVDGALAADDPQRFLAEFDGDDRYFVALVRDLLLDGLPAEMHEFAVAASPLERLSGPLCDEVLSRTGSALLLERLASHTMLLLRLDRKRTWYRFHHMFRQLLRAERELCATGLPSNTEVLRRASSWYEHHGDVDAAIECAALAHDSVRATDLVLDHFSERVGLGAPRAVEAWLTGLTEVRVPSNPSLESVSALIRMGLGDPAGSLRSIRRAEFGLPERYPTEGPFVQAATCVAAVRALLGTAPAATMREDGRYARQHTKSPVWYAIASLAEGAAAFMVGELDYAAEAVQSGAALAETCSYTTMSVCLSQLALVAEHSGQPAEALRLVRQARQVIREHSLEHLPQVQMTLVLSGLYELRAGHEAVALADAALGRAGMAASVGLGPWSYIQSLIALAHMDRLRGDSAGKAEWLRQAELLLERLPDALLVKDQIAEARRLGAPRHIAAAGPFALLSAAELRVLHYLPTHLTLSEIADRLFVSRHTVKSQVMSIYRKLGTTNRSETVQLAREASLLSDPADVRLVPS